LRREQRRAHLIQCALEVFAEKGYHQASISDIIKRAGVARGTFYLYFESKRSVFDQLLDDLFELLNGRVRRIDPSRGPAGVVAQMESNVDEVVDLMLSNRAMLRVLLAEAVGLDPGFDKKLSEFYGRLLEMTERSLKLGIDMQVVRKVNTRVVSLCILGSIKEVLYQVAMGQKLPVREILVKEILGYNIRGLFAPEVAEQVESLTLGGQ
jgi:TetR/AcrR family fatty acid metabolism transcriptional regulator